MLHSSLVDHAVKAVARLTAVMAQACLMHTIRGSLFEYPHLGYCESPIGSLWTISAMTPGHCCPELAKSVLKLGQLVPKRAQLVPGLANPVILGPVQRP